MSWILRIIAILSQLQNTQLVQDIETCILTNSTPASIWQCVLGKISAAKLPPNSPDAAVVSAAEVMATKANL